MASASTLTTLDGLLKNVYLPGVTEWINENRPLWKRIDRINDKKRFVGRKFILAAKDVNPQGVGARAEGGTLPTPLSSSIKNMELQMKYHYAIISLTAQVMAQAKGDPGAFADAVDTEVMGARNQLEEDLALNAVFGTGNGELGKVNGAPSGNTVTLQNAPGQNGFNGVRFIRNGMALDSFTATSGGSAHDAAQIASAISTAADTFTLTTVTSTAANDFIFRAGSRGNTIMGLAGLVDDGTLVATFQNLSRSANPLLQAQVLGNSGTLRAWTPELMDQGASQAWNLGGGGWPTAIYSQLSIQQRAAAYIRADRRADMGTMVLDNGYKAVTWTTPNGQIPWIVDQFVRANSVFFVREPDLFQAILEDFQWEDKDGSMWQRDIGNRTHGFEAWLFTFRNLGARQCNNCTLLKDVSHSL